MLIGLHRHNQLLKAMNNKKKLKRIDFTKSTNSSLLFTCFLQISTVSSKKNRSADCILFLRFIHKLKKNQ